MRTRDWRRYVEEVHVIRRLNRLLNTGYFWRGITDINDIHSNKPMISHYLGNQQYFDSKTITTRRWNSEDKQKYSPNKCRSKYRYKDYGRTREEDKLLFLKILKENGIK
jgi:hypothetical protein